MKYALSMTATAMAMTVFSLPLLAEPKADHHPAGTPNMHADCPMMLPGKPQHEGHHSMQPATDHDTASTQALRKANLRMHKAMDITYTGNADVDFLRGMIAHHQGAVEMAEVVLDNGQNPQVRRLARDIIRAQNLEIKWMKEWLAQLDKNPQPGQPPLPQTGSVKPKWNDAAWDGSTWMGER